MREHQLMYRETARKYELVKQIETAITYAGTHILEKRNRKSDERTTRQSLLRRRNKKGIPLKLYKKVEENLIGENQLIFQQVLNCGKYERC